MNLNSIQWRLQIWYGLILLAVLAGLGVAACELERGKMTRQIDVELNERVKILANTLNGPPPRPADDAGPRPEAPDGAGPPPEGGDGFGPPPGPPRRWPPPPEHFQLPQRYEGLFGGDDFSGFYYVVTGSDGHEIARSKNGPVPGRPSMEREIVTPTGERILAGRFIAVELAELHRAEIELATVGAVVLALGLAVGWVLVSRALRPIADISAAAEQIAGGDLSRRIDVEETRSELGRLAEVLNSTFSRLEATFAQQKRFAADAAHELRTPVSVLIAQTHAALMRKRSYEENQATIEACHRAAQRMRRLITALLQLARLDAGQEPPKRVQFDLLPVADECIELLKPLAGERDIKITLDMAPTPVFGDAEQIHQVISNLVTNAIQYNKPGGEVRIAARRDNGSTAITVSDTGMGIPSRHLPHVFERFYRADESRSSGHVGLGLAISKAIIDAHGGAIEVSSQENAGATFTVRLPA
jgi:two-component system OmpR family sensor kinase